MGKSIIGLLTVSLVLVFTGIAFSAETSDNTQLVKDNKGVETYPCENKYLDPNSEEAKKILNESIECYMLRTKIGKDTQAGDVLQPLGTGNSDPGITPSEEGSTTDSPYYAPASVDEGISDGTGDTVSADPYDAIGNTAGEPTVAPGYEEMDWPDGQEPTAYYPCDDGSCYADTPPPTDTIPAPSDPASEIEKNITGEDNADPNYPYTYNDPGSNRYCDDITGTCYDPGRFTAADCTDSLCGKNAGLRQNNAGNIERVAANDWVGEVPLGSPGCTSERFTCFSDPEYGIRAAYRTQLTYETKHNLETIQERVKRFAPKNENDVNNYTDIISKTMGIPKDQSFSITDPVLGPAFMKGKMIAETSNPYSDTQIINGYRLAFNYNPNNISGMEQGLQTMIADPQNYQIASNGQVINYTPTNIMYAPGIQPPTLLGASLSSMTYGDTGAGVLMPASSPPSPVNMITNIGSTLGNSIALFAER